MTTASPMSLSEIESLVFDIIVAVNGGRREKLRPDLRLVQDLGLDSLSFVDMVFRIEKEFQIKWPDDSSDLIHKSIFTRNPLRVRDLVEMIYLQLEKTQTDERPVWRRTTSALPPTAAPFTQLGGSFLCEPGDSLYDSVGKNREGFPTLRRRPDGMICVQIPPADVTLGSDTDGAMSDEKPVHSVRLDGFVIDQEPVSTSAYCRFLNSVGMDDPEMLREWFVLPENDSRRDHELIRCEESEWLPVSGTERLPMILVSWYGASAYALWAHQRDVRGYRDESASESIPLPSEAQWEYAARGAQPRAFPWGDEEPAAHRMHYAQHERGRTYTARTMPLAEVNEELGVSPFGLRHMAGNVWQWCRDWYAPDFYSRPDANEANAVNRVPSRVRSERGGSWIGPAFLCRSSYRRGRSSGGEGAMFGISMLHRCPVHERR